MVLEWNELQCVMDELSRYAEPMIRRAHLLASCPHAENDTAASSDLLWGLRHFHNLDARLIASHMQEVEKTLTKLHTSVAVLGQHLDEMGKICQELQERLDHDQTLLDLRVLSTSSCSAEPQMEIIPAPTEYVQWALAILKFFSVEFCRIQTAVSNLEGLARAEVEKQATAPANDSQVKSMLELGLGKVPIDVEP